MTSSIFCNPINPHTELIDENCVVSFQPYNNRGFALEPLFMGTVGELDKQENNTFKYTVEINKEDARFRLLVSKEGKFKNKS